VVSLFSSLEKIIPWIAFALLGWIGGKMLWEGLRERNGPDAAPADRRLSNRDLLMQGIATSIDALSVGFTIEQYDFGTANVASLLIGGVTFVLCMAALLLGRRLGTKLARYASILGVIILIGIGFKIFLGGLG
jgi:putative Mn2+ efflux pump MntP